MRQGQHAVQAEPGDAGLRRGELPDRVKLLNRVGAVQLVALDAGQHIRPEVLAPLHGLPLAVHKPALVEPALVCEPPVVGRGHVSLLTNLDTWHSEHFTDIWCLPERVAVGNRVGGFVLRVPDGCAALADARRRGARAVANDVRVPVGALVDACGTIGVRKNNTTSYTASPYVMARL